MEEKNLVTLPDFMVEYLEFVKKFLSVRSALFVNIESFGGNKDKVMNYLSDSSNQEKFVYACVNGYKVEEKKFLVKVRNCSNANCLNYNTNEKIFTFNTEEESRYHKTHFTREFLEKNYFGWVFNCEGMLVIEVREHD